VNRSAARTFGIVALVALCVVCSLVAVFGLFVYVREIVLSIGSNDKSLLFWYLPILFIGIIALKIALVAGRGAYRRIRGKK
jgi:hypothetical protein